MQFNKETIQTNRKLISLWNWIIFFMYHIYIEIYDLIYCNRHDNVLWMYCNRHDNVLWMFCNRHDSVLWMYCNRHDNVRWMYFNRHDNVFTTWKLHYTWESTISSWKTHSACLITWQTVHGHWRHMSSDCIAYSHTEINPFFINRNNWTDWCNCKASGAHKRVIYPIWKGYQYK